MTDQPGPSEQQHSENSTSIHDTLSRLKLEITQIRKCDDLGVFVPDSDGTTLLPKNKFCRELVRSILSHLEQDVNLIAPNLLLYDDFVEDTDSPFQSVDDSRNSVDSSSENKHPAEADSSCPFHLLILEQVGKPSTSVLLVRRSFDLCSSNENVTTFQLKISTRVFESPNEEQYQEQEERTQNEQVYPDEQSLDALNGKNYFDLDERIVVHHGDVISSQEYENNYEYEEMYYYEDVDYMYAEHQLPFENEELTFVTAEDIAQYDIVEEVESQNVEDDYEEQEFVEEMTGTEQFHDMQVMEVVEENVYIEEIVEQRIPKRRRKSRKNRTQQEEPIYDSSDEEYEAVMEERRQKKLREEEEKQRLLKEMEETSSEEEESSEDKQEETQPKTGYVYRSYTAEISDESDFERKLSKKLPVGPPQKRKKFQKRKRNLRDDLCDALFDTSDEDSDDDANLPINDLPLESTQLSRMMAVSRMTYSDSDDDVVLSDNQEDGEEEDTPQVFQYLQEDPEIYVTYLTDPTVDLSIDIYNMGETHNTSEVVENEVVEVVEKPKPKRKSRSKKTILKSNENIPDGAAEEGEGTTKKVSKKSSARKKTSLKRKSDDQSSENIENAATDIDGQPLPAKRKRIAKKDAPPKKLNPNRRDISGFTSETQFFDPSIFHVEVDEPPKKNKYTCEFCFKDCEERKKLDRHLLSHVQYRIECPLCDKKFRYRYNLYPHWRRFCLANVPNVDYVSNAVLAELACERSHWSLDKTEQYKNDLMDKVDAEEVHTKLVQEKKIIDKRKVIEKENYERYMEEVQAMNEIRAMEEVTEDEIDNFMEEYMADVVQEGMDGGYEHVIEEEVLEEDVLYDDAQEPMYIEAFPHDQPDYSHNDVQTLYVENEEEMYGFEEPVYNQFDEFNNFYFDNIFN